MPAYAQNSDNSQSSNPFFSFIQMIERIFHFGGASAQANTNPTAGTNQAAAMPQGSGAPNASGQGRGNPQEMEQNRLNQLVSQGKITGSQEQAILTELQTVRAKDLPQSSPRPSQTQMQQNFQAMQSELTAWANSQGIDPTYVLPQRPSGSGFPGGRSGRGGYGQGPQASPSS